MRKEVTSFAMLSTLNSYSKTGYIEIFVPFLATLFFQERLNVIAENEIHDLCAKFKSTFGLNIPPQAMISILRKAQGKDLLSKKHKSFYVNEDLMRKYDFSEKQKLQEIKNSNFKKVFTEFCDNEFGIEINDDEIEIVLLSFLKKNDLKIMITDTEKSIIGCHFQTPKKFKYIEKALNKFIVMSYEEKQEYFDYLLEISLGHLMASTISLEDYKYDQDTVKNCNVYIDTPLIFDLLGTHGDHMKKSASMLISSLRKNGAKLKIFNHNVGEVEENLKNAIEILEDGDYKQIQKNYTAKNYYNLKFSADQVRNVLNSLKSSLVDFELIDKPSYKGNYGYQIDSNKFENMLREAYHKPDSSMDRTIKNDLNSIEGIYHLRESKTPKLISQAKHIFLTSNSTFVRVSIKFSESDPELKGSLPASLTDVFLGTVLWMKSNKEIEYKKEKFIGSCYNAIQPNYHFQMKFIEEVERLNRDNLIDEKSPLNLIESKTIESMLFNKTFGEPELITEKNLLEIEEAHKAQIEKPLIEKNLKDKETIEDLEMTLTNFKNENLELKNKKKNKLNKIDNMIAKRELEIKKVNKVIFNCISWGLVVLVIPASWVFQDIVVKLWEQSKYIAICVYLILFTIIYFINKFKLNKVELRIYDYKISADKKIKELSELKHDQ